MHRILILFMLISTVPAVPAQTLPAGAESRADELRLRRGDPDIVRYIERERRRLEVDRLDLERARLQLERDRIRLEREETLSRERSLR